VVGRPYPLSDYLNRKHIMPIRKREIPFNLWAMSHTYDVLENRSYDEAWGPRGPNRHSKCPRIAPLTLHREDEIDRINAGLNRNGERIDLDGLPLSGGDEGPRHTRSWEETARSLLHAVELLDGMTLAEALDRFNPDGDPAVTRLLTRLLTPGMHVCGRH
jgi:hypothetical protein